MLPHRSLLITKATTTTTHQTLHAFIRPKQNGPLCKELLLRNRSSTSHARLGSLRIAILSAATLALSQSRLAFIREGAASRRTRFVVTRSWSSLGASCARHTEPYNMATGSASADKKAEKSTWASAVDSINPWAGSRSSTPVPKEPSHPPPPNPGSSGGDHSINLVYGLSARKYPPDCPPLKVKWFHAVDVWNPFNTL